MKLVISTLLVFSFSLASRAEEKSIRVFVALCDNAFQGIVPVPQWIGNSDQPDSNFDLVKCAQKRKSCFVALSG